MTADYTRVGLFGDALLFGGLALAARTTGVLWSSLAAACCAAGVLAFALFAVLQAGADRWARR